MTSVEITTPTTANIMASKIAIVAILAAFAAENGVLGAPATSSDAIPDIADISPLTNLTDIDGFSDAYNPLCPGLQKRWVCCKTSFLGLIHMSCVAPFPAPDSPLKFVESCAAEAKTAQCCLINLVRLPCSYSNPFT